MEAEKKGNGVTPTLEVVKAGGGKPKQETGLARTQGEIMIPMGADQSKEDRLLEMVLQGGNIEVLERFIALRKSEQERESRLEFEAQFAKMRKELPAILKDKAASKDGKVLYTYAPIEEIQRVCDPVIFAHGFSYTWREEAIPEGKRIWMDVSGYGYTRSNFFDCPKISGTSIQNPIQVAGAMSTYGRRYTFIAGFGVVIEGEDSDGQIPDDVEVLRMDLEKLLSLQDPHGDYRLPKTARDAISKEIAKPDPDKPRLKAFYKRAQELCR